MTSSDHRRPSGRGRFARDSLVLASGSMVAGLLAYVFVAMATQSLGADGAAPVSVLWSYWAAAAAVLTFSVQHWMIATIAAGHETTVARLLPRIAGAGAALSAVAGVIAFTVRDPLFHDRGVAFPALMALVTAGSLLTGVVRGALAGRGRYVASGVSVMLENAVRVAGAGAAALVDAGPLAYGVALAVGPLSGLLFVGSLRFERTPVAGSSQPVPSHSVRSPLAQMSGIAGGSLLAQVMLTSAPVALAVIGGSPLEVTSVFVALAVWRAPHLVAQGVSPQLTSWLAGLAGQRRRSRLARLRTTTLAATAVAAGVAALLAVSVMPWLLRTVFSPDITLSTSVLVALGVGTAMALGSLVLLLLLLALGRSRSATLAWTAASIIAVSWLVLGSGEPVTRVAVAFLLAQVVAFAWLLLSATPPPLTQGAASAGAGG